MQLDRPGPLGAAHTATMLVDDAGEVTGWSPGAFRLLGYTAQEAVGLPAKSLLSTGGSDMARRLFSGTESGATTTVFRTRSGAGVTVEVLAVPARESSGRPGDGQRLCVLTPVHEDGHDLLEWSFDQFPFMAAIMDRDLRYLRWNREAAKAFRTPEADVVGRTLVDTVADPERDRIQEAMRLARDTGRRTSLDTFVHLPNDTLGHVWQGHFVPLKDARGEVRAVYSVGIDIGVQHLARERLALLNQASVSIGSTLDVQRTAEELAAVLVPGIADYVTVDLLESVLSDAEPEFELPERGFHPTNRTVALRRMAQQSVLDGAPEAVMRPGDVDLYPTEGRHVQTLVTGDSYMSPGEDDPSHLDWVSFSERRLASTRTFGLHSAMIVPMRARGTVLGLAVFVRHRNPERFTPDDLLLAEEITARGAVCLDNALRFTRQRATALAFQHSLLPQHLPQQTAVETASRYLPAGTKAGVGGDWFDVIPLSGARVALVVGDVVGHGIRASATMGRLRTAVRTLSDVGLPPDELLARLDDIVGRPVGRTSDEDEPDTDTGASCIYAVYDPVTRRCTVSCAGHPLPLLAYADGTVVTVDVPVGPPLGLGGLPFESVEIDIPEDSLIALYTDGLISTRDGDLDDRQETLRRALADPPASLEAACDGILHTMLGGGRTEDDVALLLARAHGLEADRVATWDLPADPEAVAEARGLTSARLAQWGLEEIGFTTELVVSELVTNAMRHASGPIRLRLILQDELTCEVADSSDTYPHMRQARTYDEGGRGLMLVAQLSERWGTRPTGQGKIIWANQSLPRRHRRPPA